MKRQNSLGRELLMGSLYFAMLFVSIPTIKAQDYYCATPDEFNNPQDLDTTSIFSGSIDPDYLATFDPVVYNIYFWQVNDANGNNNNPLTEDYVLKAVADINMEYNAFNIFFKYRGLGEMDSPPDIQQVIWQDANGDGELECVLQFDANGDPIPDPNGWGRLSRCQYDEMFDYAQTSGHYLTDAFNVYVPWQNDDFGGVADEIYSTLLTTTTNNLHRPTFPHELGHCLGLLHTHFNYESSGCEHVERDPNVDGFNAIEFGDKVPDTAAMPNFIQEYCFFVLGHEDAMCGSEPYSRYYLDETSCTYIGFNYDCEDTPYIITPTDVRNYMGYSYGSCQNNFTVGQGIRMREMIAWDFDNKFEVVETPLASLYEPYKGEYIEYTSQPNSDPPLFQPGFEYYFWECECQEQTPCNDPAPYEDTSFSYTDTQILHILKDESDYSSITHPNHSAIAIKHPHEDFWPQPRRCFDNWQTPPIIGGTITLFHDGIFNANVTITAQDSLQMNNTHLINDLDPGLYNIKKSKIDGSIEETNVLKENE
ncbi:MAG: hypothetical protein KTR22_00265 [Flavobacteriaceae bacterium]|nr:hypothetical protein [Flavobacteriaceae bacterium]